MLYKTKLKQDINGGLGNHKAGTELKGLTEQAATMLYQSGFANKPVKDEASDEAAAATSTTASTSGGKGGDKA